jgi:TPR repeat protein
MYNLVLIGELKMVNIDKEQIKWQMEQMSPEVQEFWLAAQQGDAEAQFKLGDAFFSGTYLPEEAIRWFHKAAEQGHIQAKYYLYMALDMDNDEGISWLRQLAEQGYAEAQLDLARNYQNTDIAQAIYWLRQAAEQKDIVTELTPESISFESPQNDARNELGDIYQFGKDGIARDYEQALYWYQKAAAHGSERAKSSIEFLQRQMQYLDDCRQAAERGDAEAQYRLGREEKSPDKALYWYNKSAEQGHINAQFDLAQTNQEQAVYWYRQIAERKITELKIDNTQFDLNKRKNETQDNYEKRMTWYRQNLKKTYIEAQFNLAYAYDNGEGINQDDKQAVYWYRKAAENGHKRAQFFLGNAYYEGQFVPQNYQQAVYWYQQAAQDTDILKGGEKGDTDAQFNLAYAYQKGEGIYQDDGKAIYWYAKVANAEAQLQIGKIYDKAEMIQDYEQLISWYRELEVNNYISGYDSDHDKKNINQRLDKEKARYAQYFGPKGYKKHIVSKCKNKATDCYQEAIKRGSSKALLYIGIQQDNDESIRSLCQIAVNTIIDNEEYDELELTEEDDEKAISLLQNQAEQGLFVAQTVLAYLYKTGNAIPQDKQKALFWFEKAAQQQDIVAQYWLGKIYHEQQQLQKAQEYFQKASQNHQDREYDELDMTKIESLAKSKLLILIGYVYPQI